MLKKDVTKKMLVEDAAQDIEPADLENEAFTPDIVTWLKVMGWEAPAEEAVEETESKTTEPEETEPEDAPEPKKEPAKEKKTPAKKTPAKADPDAKKDEFGFGIGTKRNLFAESIRENPMTMAEVKQEDWNDPPQSFYQAWSVIKASGKGKTDDKTMSISE